MRCVWRRRTSTSCSSNHTWSFGILLPLIVLGLFIVLVAIYPFIEAWITGDKREHHIAQRPRNAATRTAIGVAGVIFYAVLWAAASSDLIATHFMLTMEGVIHTLQALLFVGPVLGYFVDEAHRTRAAEEGSRDRAARLRVGTHRAPPRWRVHRGAPAGRPVRPLEAHRRRRLRAPGGPPEREGPHLVDREPAFLDLALVLRGPSRPAHAGRDRGRGCSPAPRRRLTTTRPRPPRSRALTSAPASRTRRSPSSETHVDETPNTPSTVISTEPVKKPRKKKSEDGE